MTSQSSLLATVLPLLVIGCQPLRPITTQWEVEVGIEHVVLLPLEEMVARACLPLEVEVGPQSSNYSLSLSVLDLETRTHTDCAVTLDLKPCEEREYLSGTVYLDIVAKGAASESVVRLRKEFRNWPSPLPEASSFACLLQVDDPHLVVIDPASRGRSARFLAVQPRSE